MSSDQASKLVVTTKLNDGSVQFLVYKARADGLGPTSLDSAFYLAANDLGCLKTNIIGGATGATGTFKSGKRTITHATGDPDVAED